MARTVKRGGVTLQIKDDRLRKALKDGARVPDFRVGVLGARASAPHHSSGWTVGELAAAHELGIGVPQRSWLREWIREDRDFISDTWAEELGKALYDPRSRAAVSEALETVAKIFVIALQFRISLKGVKPALKASTIAGKGHDIPLYDSGQLRQSITYEVDR